MAWSTSIIPDMHVVGAAAGAVCVPRRRDSNGEMVDNITDWAFQQFRRHYQPGRAKQTRPITKDAIFHYVYAVLHDPSYRAKYALNLKRDFPQLPLYPDFWLWAGWGADLMHIHTEYENVAPAKLGRVDRIDERAKESGTSPKVLLKADKTAGKIFIDSETTLDGVPSAAWTYQLGNRSALEWILDQYKEKQPKDQTVREQFNTYRFAHYKEEIIELLSRVAAVSVHTVEIMKAMEIRGNR